MSGSADWVIVVGVAASASGIILGWTGRSRSARKDTQEEAGRDGRLSSDVDYIKRGIDEMRLEQKAQGSRVEGLSERIIRLEESAKQAHHRIDRVETKLERTDSK